MPTGFYDHIMLNGPRRDEQIENMIVTVRNIARAGIPIFGYNWMPSHVWRTPPAMIRGGAVATAFDDALAQRMPLTHDRVYTEEEMWTNLEYWIKIITPIAEEEGIRLGIHPCDPPVPVLGGIPQLLRNFAAYKRLVEIYPSDCNGIEFCQGTMAEMDDEVDIYDKIRYFGSRNKILYVHFRNVSGTVPAFREEFINTGYVDMFKAMEISRRRFGSFLPSRPIRQSTSRTPGATVGAANGISGADRIKSRQSDRPGKTAAALTKGAREPALPVIRAKPGDLWQSHAQAVTRTPRSPRLVYASG